MHTGVGSSWPIQSLVYTAGVAAIIFSLTPVVTAVLAWVLLPAERLSRRDYAGVLLGLSGLAVVISPDPASLLDPAVVGESLASVDQTPLALGMVFSLGLVVGPVGLVLFLLFVG